MTLKMLPPWLATAAILIGMAGSWSPARSAPDANAASSPPLSVVEFPIEMSLAPLRRAAETSLPRQTGNGDSWQPWHGIETRYLAWRGPLDFRMLGDTLRVQVHVRYWLQARKRLFGSFDLGVGCGVDEAPRQAVIGLLVRFRWAPNWSLHPEFRILPTRFLDSCEVTVADLDVTPLVERLFQQELKQHLRAGMRALSPRLAAIRGEARRIWESLQAPIALGADSWLQLDPVAIAVSPFFGAGNEVRLRLAMAMRPRVLSGPRPTVDKRPLPPLQPLFPSRSGLTFRLRLDIDFSELEERLTAELADKTFQIGQHTLSVEKVRLSGKADELSAILTFAGDAAGKAEIWADIGFAPESQQLLLHDLGFTFDPVDPDLGVLSDLFYERIRQALETTANAFLRRYLERLHAGLLASLERIAPAAGAPDISAIRLREVEVDMTPLGIALEGVASGSIRFGHQREPRLAPASPVSHPHAGHRSIPNPGTPSPFGGRFQGWRR